MLLDLLLLWDAIFADSDRFDLPNYILVAMLVHIRDKRGYSLLVLPALKLWHNKFRFQCS